MFGYCRSLYWHLTNSNHVEILCTGSSGTAFANGGRGEGCRVLLMRNQVRHAACAFKKRDRNVIVRREKTKIMHRVVEHSGVVYLGGVIADEVNGTSMRDQAAEVCGKIEKLLSDAGSDKSKLLSATVFITDMSQKAEMNDVWTSWLPAEDLPCRATIGVSDLGQNVLIEIVVTAAA